MKVENTPIIVTVSGKTVDEVREKLVKLAREFGHDDKQESLPLIPVSAGSDLLTTPSDGPQTTSTRGRHKKDCACERCAKKDSAESTAVSAAPAVDAPVDSKVDLDPKPAKVSKEQALDALKKVQSTISLTKCIELLKKHDASKFSELEEKNFAQFVADCKEALKSKSA